jgi:hypothetical protein
VHFEPVETVWIGEVGTKSGFWGQDMIPGPDSGTAYCSMIGAVRALCGQSDPCDGRWWARWISKVPPAEPPAGASWR